MKPAKMVTKNRNVLDWMNLGLSSPQTQLLFCGSGFVSLYQANPRIEKVRPIKIGLYGSIQEKVAAIPVAPENNANTGVIQHREATIAEKRPAKIPWLGILVFFILCNFSFGLYIG